MSIEWITAILLASIFLAFALGAPVGFALGAIAMAVGLFTWGEVIFNLVPSTFEATLFSFILLAIPLYIYMGQILTRSGIGDAMFRLCQLAIGRVRGALAISVVGVSSMIGAMVGIIGAGIMTSGSLALKPMLDQGYDRRLALGVIMAGGSLGILIPPSIPMIMFAATTQSSVGKMFVAAVIPALLMITLLVAYIAVSCRLNPARAPMPVAAGADEQTPRQKRVIIRDGMLAFLLIFLVLGSIISGVATPTESGAIGVLGALALAFFFKRLRLDTFKLAGRQTALLVSVSMWIILGASVFSNFHLLMGVQGMVSDFTQGLDLPPLMIILLMQLVMLLLGFIIDEFIIVLVCAPLFTPVVVALGYDPVWFGVLMIINIAIAVQTPPYGFALFYLKGIAPPDIKMQEIYRSVLPFISVKVAVLMLCLLFPEMVMWLPNRVMG